MDLVEGGDVWRLFSDAELLEMAAEEEARAARPPGDPGNGTQPSRRGTGGVANTSTNQGLGRGSSLSTMAGGSVADHGDGGGNGISSTIKGEVHTYHAGVSRRRFVGPERVVVRAECTVERGQVLITTICDRFSPYSICREDACRRVLRLA